MDLDDFILAEVEEKKEQTDEEKLEAGMKKLHFELLNEDRPSSIPPDEPFEDLGLVEEKANQTVHAAPPVMEDEIIPMQVFRLLKFGSTFFTPIFPENFFSKFENFYTNFFF